MSTTAELVSKIKNGQIESLDKTKFLPSDYAIPNGYADKIAKEIADAKEEMKVTQLRKVFNEIKRIQGLIKTEDDLKKQHQNIFLILPELAYARGRKLITSDFYDLLKECLTKEVNNKRNIRLSSKGEFDNFVKFLEAILAYYKMYSSKKGGSN